MEIRHARLDRPEDAQVLVGLLDAYARDPMGGGKPLPEAVKERVPRDLARLAHAFVLLAFEEGVPAGVAVCFEGYSTFRGAPLVNLHDFAVAPAFRGRGVARSLLAELEREARARRCCKITLEVLSGNARARGVYARAGFGGYQLTEATGQALFLEKFLD